MGEAVHWYRSVRDGRGWLLGPRLSYRYIRMYKIIT